MAITRSSRAITSIEAKTRKKRIVVVVGLALAAPAASCAQAPAKPVAEQPGAAGSFFDDFKQLDQRRWYISDGWTNGGHQGCTWSRANVAASGGTVSLVLARANDRQRPYRCAEIRTYARHGYGVYEARMRTAAGSGLNTAMFTYSGPPTTPVHDEIDFEFLGKASSNVQLNYYVTKRGGNESAPALGFDASAGFHDYAFVWKPGRIDWYVDGKLVRSAEGAAMPVTAGQFFFSLWNGTSSVDGWLGAFDASRTPVQAEIEWAGFTKAGEKCRFAQSLTCRLSP
jgi:endo-1,3-1,4-beta-glycanase ExoK